MSTGQEAAAAPPRTSAGPLGRYALGLASVLAAVILREALDPVLGDESPLLVFTLPVAVTALSAGFGPAILATLASLLAGTWLFIGDFSALDLSNQARLGLFLTVCLSISLLAKKVRDTHAKDLKLARLNLQQAEREQLIARLMHENREYDRYFALSDPLTGLPNARALRQELDRMLAHAQRSAGMVHAALVNVDGLRRINEAHGHSAGDELLAQMAERLRGCLRAGDYVARHGGDEFVILVQAPTPQAPDALERLQHRVADLLRGRYELEEGPAIEPRVSIGGASSEADEREGAALLARAQEAMYQGRRVRDAQRHAQLPGVR